MTLLELRFAPGESSKTISIPDVSQKGSVLHGPLKLSYLITNATQTLNPKSEDGAKMVAVRVDTKPAEAIP
jgi:hypothetical protein